jgi:murein DD-endopeptidase MepM/ murein hydrolase activator NlpD
MVELKQEYQSYIVALKKVLHDYNTLVAQENDDLGKLASERYSQLAVRAARAVERSQKNQSSDQTESKDTNFVVVNREISYLKQSMIDYLKAEKLDNLLNHLDLDEWRDYSDQVIDASKSKPSERKRKPAPKRPRPIVSSGRLKKIYATRPATMQHDISLAWPIERTQFWLSSFFGPRKKPKGFHTGVDMAASQGTPVRAAETGVVIRSGYYSGYGNMIEIVHNNKYRTRYAHLHKILAQVGTKVQKGALIGEVGSTGHVHKKGTDASHLHFEVHMFGRQVDPLYFLI